MFKKVFIFTVLLSFSVGSYAFAGCSTDEAMAKAKAFQEVVVDVAQKDPQKYQEIMTAMQNDLPALQTSDNMDALCKFYDDWTEKLK